MESKTDIKGINKKARDRVRSLFHNHNVAVEDKTAVKHDLFLALLKSRHGYSNDKAVVELERLLRQFDLTNKSLGVKHVPPIRSVCRLDEQASDLNGQKDPR